MAMISYGTLVAVYSQGPNALAQYGVTVLGAGFVSTERMNAFGVGMNSDGRRIFIEGRGHGLQERLDTLDLVRDTNKVKKERCSCGRGHGPNQRAHI